MAGRNRALTETRSLVKSASDSPHACIFISHISIDKAAATDIANYILGADFDVYFDENDKELQKAVVERNPWAITQFIERGRANSSHILCLVSESSVSSWWVPYELGFAKRAGKGLATLKLKGQVSLPEYLQIGRVILGTKSLNEYLSEIKATLRKSATAVYLSEGRLIAHSAQPHPLDNRLDWQA